MNIDPALSTLLGAITGGLATFAATAYTGFYTLRKEHESRRDQRNADNEKWIRDHLQESLLNVFSNLDIYIVKWLFFEKDIKRVQKDETMVRLNAEVQKWLISILMYYPDKSIAEYTETLQNVYKSNEEGVMKEEQAWAIRQLLVSLAAKYQMQINAK